jgi:branched-chain amino acid transport system ATP-binding protein
MGAVLESGVVRLVASGASLLEDPEVARLYLGAGSKTPPITTPQTTTATS